MENDTDKLIQDQFNSLPPDVREAISRVPWKDRVRDIAKREGLKDEQASSLETETMLVLYGFTAPDSYVGNITTEVGVGEEQAERINKLVSDEIIADIEKQFEMIDALAPDLAKQAPTPTPAPKEPAQQEDKNLLNISPEILAKQIKMPEIVPNDLPEVVPGETAHDVPHTEAPTPAQPKPAESAPAPVVEAPAAPKSIVEEKLSQVVSAPVQSPIAPSAESYAPGKDPYREPIE